MRNSILHFNIVAANRDHNTISHYIIVRIRTYYYIAVCILYIIISCRVEFDDVIESDDSEWASINRL